jgi:alkylhydroperoxidase family enzyme
MNDDDRASATDDPPTAWISTVPDHQWTDGPLAELHPRVVDPVHGRVDNIMAVHSLNPTGMAAHHAVYASAMRGTGSLRKVERELIALVVSLENHCHY